MTQKPRVPQTKVPIIGDKNKAQSEEFVRQIMGYLDPILQQILTSIDTLERRVTVVEEISSATLVDTLAKKVGERLDKLERPGK